MEKENSNTMFNYLNKPTLIEKQLISETISNYI